MAELAKAIVDEATGGAPEEEPEEPETPEPTPEERRAAARVLGR